MDLNFEITAIYIYYIYIFEITAIYIYVFNQINSCVFLNFMSQKAKIKTKTALLKNQKSTLILYCFYIVLQKYHFLLFNDITKL